MMKITWKITLLCSLFLLGSNIVYAEEALLAGSVLRIQGGAFSNSAENQSRNLRRSSSLYVGDTVMTGKNARVKIRLLDGGIIILGENTEFVIQEYSYGRKGKESNGLLKIAKGFFHAITGKLGKLRNRPFKIETPKAVIGVKGTEFWGGTWKNGNFDVALLNGAGLIVENEAGRVEIDRVGDGVTVTGPGVAPTQPKVWPQAKVDKAVDTVSFETSN